MPAQPWILVVDDSTAVREVLTFILRQIPEFGRAVIDQAGNGAVALNKLRAARYDLVLSDIRMPYLDGLGLVRAIRNELANRTTPVILISTLGSEEDVRRGLEAGASAYLLKPLTPGTSSRPCASSSIVGAAGPGSGRLGTLAPSR